MHRVLISAHRCAAGEGAGFDNTVAGVRHAAAVGADYVEFDVRRCRDGVFVCRHDPTVLLLDGSDHPVADLESGQVLAAAPGTVLLADLVAAVEQSGLGAHVDLKFGTPAAARARGESWEVDAATVVADRLGAAHIAFSTGRESAARALRDWTEAAGSSGHGALVGLSIGSGTGHLGWSDTLRVRRRELFPDRRFRGSGATLVVAHHALALLRLLRWARRAGVPVLVWTVDHPWLTRLLVRSPRVWMITTNHPSRAVALRGGPDSPA